MKLLNTCLLTSGVLLAAAIAYGGSVPGEMNYQGQIRTATGDPLADGNYKMTFTIYDASDGGSAVWGPYTNSAVAAVEGSFNVVLPAQDPFSRWLLEAVADSPRWLELKVGDNPAIAPRQELLSAPYSLNAERLQGHDWSAFFDNGNPATGKILGARIVDASITEGQLADNAVTSAKIQNGQVTRDDIADNTINGAKITDLTIATADLANNAVTSGKILDGTILNGDLANNSLTVTAGSGLAGGGSVALGGTTTLAVSPNSLTVTAGSGLTGGGTVALGGTTTLAVSPNSLTVTAGSGLTGGGTIALGGTTTLAVSPNSVTVATPSGSGLTGGGSIALGGSRTLSVSPNSVTVATPSGSGLTGGGSIALGGSRTLSVSPNYVTVTAGAGLTGGGPIALGGSGTLSVANGSITSSMLASDMNSLAKVSSGVMTAWSGRIGIGTSSPGVPLDVQSDRFSTTTMRAYLDYSGVHTGNWPNEPGYLSIRASQAILAPIFVVTSDERIKYISGRSDPRADLATVRQLQVTDYRYIDTISKGDQLKKGFIAQEVGKLIPEAVTVTPDFIPSIYALATAVEYDVNERTLRLTLAQPHELIVGDQVRLYTSQNMVERTVTRIPSKRQFVVSNCAEPVEGGVFVYGKYVTDFLTLDYDQLFTTAIGAIQELANQLDAQDVRISQLEGELAALSSPVNIQDEESEIQLLKSEVATLKSIVLELSKQQK